MIRTFAALSTAWLLIATPSASAQEQKEAAPPLSGIQGVLAEMNMHIADKADAALSAYLDTAHKAVLVDLAYQLAVASNCPGYEVDQERKAEALEGVFETISAINDEAEQDKAVLVTMMGLSTLIGGQHAIAAFDYEGYCQHFADEEIGSDQIILTKVK